MENCTDKAIDLNGGQPATTKENKESHGYGIKSIRKAAEKYGGCMTLEQQDGWFIMTVLIPLAEEKSGFFTESWGSNQGLRRSTEKLHAEGA